MCERFTFVVQGEGAWKAVVRDLDGTIVLENFRVRSITDGILYRRETPCCMDPVRVEVGTPVTIKDTGEHGTVVLTSGANSLVERETDKIVVHVSNDALMYRMGMSIDDPLPPCHVVNSYLVPLEEGNVCTAEDETTAMDDVEGATTEEEDDEEETTHQETAMIEVVDITKEEEVMVPVMETEATIPLALFYRPTIEEMHQYRADLRYETWMTKKLQAVASYSATDVHFQSPNTHCEMLTIMVGFDATYEMLSVGSFRRPITDLTNVLSNTMYNELQHSSLPPLCQLPPGVHLPHFGVTGVNTHYIAKYTRKSKRILLEVKDLDDDDILRCDSKKQKKVRPATLSHEATHYHEDCFPDVLRRAMAKHLESWSHRAQEQDGQTGYMNVQPYVGNQRVSMNRGYQVQTCFEGNKYFLGRYVRTEVGAMVAIAARLDSSNIYNSSTAYEWVHKMVCTPNAAQDWVARVRPDLKSFKRKRFMVES